MERNSTSAGIALIFCGFIFISIGFSFIYLHTIGLGEGIGAEIYRTAITTVIGLSICFAGYWRLGGDEVIASYLGIGFVYQICRSNTKLSKHSCEVVQIIGAPLTFLSGLLTLLLCYSYLFKHQLTILLFIMIAIVCIGLIIFNMIVAIRYIKFLKLLSKNGFSNKENELKLRPEPVEIPKPNVAHPQYIKKKFCPECGEQNNGKVRYCKSCHTRF